MKSQDASYLQLKAQTESKVCALWDQAVQNVFTVSTLENKQVNQINLSTLVLALKVVCC